MSGDILTTSKMGKPGASCVVPTLGAAVNVLTDRYWNGTGIRVSVSIPVVYPGFQIPESPSTSMNMTFAESPMVLFRSNAATAGADVCLLYQSVCAYSCESL